MAQPHAATPLAGGVHYGKGSRNRNLCQRLLPRARASKRRLPFLPMSLLYILVSPLMQLVLYDVMMAEFGLYEIHDVFLLACVIGLPSALLAVTLMVYTTYSLEENIYGSSSIADTKHPAYHLEPADLVIVAMLNGLHTALNLALLCQTRSAFLAIATSHLDPILNLCIYPKDELRHCGQVGWVLVLALLAVVASIIPLVVLYPTPMIHLSDELTLWVLVVCTCVTSAVKGKISHSLLMMRSRQNKEETDDEDAQLHDFYSGSPGFGDDDDYLCWLDEIFEEISFKGLGLGPDVRTSFAWSSISNLIVCPCLFIISAMMKNPGLQSEAKGLANHAYAAQTVGLIAVAYAALSQIAFPVTISSMAFADNIHGNRLCQLQSIEMVFVTALAMGFHHKLLANIATEDLAIRFSTFVVFSFAHVILTHVHQKKMHEWLSQEEIKVEKEMADAALRETWSEASGAEEVIHSAALSPGSHLSSKFTKNVAHKMNEVHFGPTVRVMHNSHLKGQEIICDVPKELRAVKTDTLEEFRQSYHLGTERPEIVDKSKTAMSRKLRQRKTGGAEEVK